MRDFSTPFEVTICISSFEQLTAVYALLGGASLAAVASGNVGSASAKPVTGPSSAGSATVAQESPAPAGTGPAATIDASPSETLPADDAEVDTGGHPWSPDLHASTKNKTKEGYWRMKVGVSRPDNKPGFPKADGGASTGATGTSNNGAVTEATGSASAGNAGQVTADEDDEFAAFRAAADKQSATDNAAAANVPARKWTEADLGALCNQAAVKLGDPDPVRKVIAAFVPEGQVGHSRNVPEDKREEFAQAIEKAAGITFAG